MIGEQLDLWQDEVSALPWGGQAPRSLAKELVTIKLVKYLRGRTCVVDKSAVRSPSREALRIIPDAAQFQLCVSTSFKGG